MIKRIQATIEAHRTVVGLLASAGAAVLAVVWLIVVPDKVNEVAGVQSWAIRYAHSLCWVFLSAAFALYAVRAPSRLSQTMGWLGLASYAAFFAAVAL